MTTEAEIKTATAIYDQAFNDVMNGTALTIRKAVAARVAEALATARAETWAKAANLCENEQIEFPDTEQAMWNKAVVRCAEVIEAAATAKKEGGE